MLNYILILISILSIVVSIVLFSLYLWYLNLYSYLKTNFRSFLPSLKQLSQNLRVAAKQCFATQSVVLTPVAEVPPLGEVFRMQSLRPIQDSLTQNLHLIRSSGNSVQIGI